MGVVTFDLARSCWWEFICPTLWVSVYADDGLGLQQYPGKLFKGLLEIRSERVRGAHHAYVLFQY